MLALRACVHAVALVDLVPNQAVLTALVGLALFFLLTGGFAWLSVRYIPHHSVGIVEKLWASQGSLGDGGIIALQGEAGFQAELLRGGIHARLWRWQYRIHRVPLVTIPQGKIGYIYARDGQPLPPRQTLGRIVACNYYQDARAFLTAANGDEPGQRGRQRAILREGVYAINLALFVVVTEDRVYTLPGRNGVRELEKLLGWHEELKAIEGFGPVVIGGPMQTPDPVHPDKTLTVDGIGIVTVHDGPSLPPGEIIAPAVGTEREDPHYHNNFQDPEAFLEAGGRRGRQYAPLTDGTYFINRWFATVERLPKTVVPIGFVGVVVSYYGRMGRDVSGVDFRHGERVTEGERGVWQRPLGPGKYAFNTYAGAIILAPTTNFVLHWITGKSESHRYDESLRSIDLVTRDAYEPTLPLSVVVHIDYQKAPSVIQRFGDVKKLITQTLDPMLSAFFRDVAHKNTMLELLHDRDQIQAEAREELRRKFLEFDIECVDVLIGKPETEEAHNRIETLLEQLRLRQLSLEQLETFERQREAAEKLGELNEAQARAKMQTELTNSRVQIQITESHGEAELARSRKQADQTIVQAEAELARSRRQAQQTVVQAEAELAKARKQSEQIVVTAEAESRRLKLAGRGEAQRILQEGLSEASVLARKIAAYHDPRLYAFERATQQLAHSEQPLVPERLFVTSNNGDGASAGSGQGALALLLQLLTAEKSGIALDEMKLPDQLAGLMSKLNSEAVESLQHADENHNIEEVTQNV